MPLLDPTKRNPMTLPDGTVVPEVVHLNRVIDHPRMVIGDFSYYHDFQVRADYAAVLAPYLFPFSTEKLVIGRFVQIAHGTRFITASANHDLGGFSTYPFRNFMMTAGTTEEEVAALLRTVDSRGDTVVGNDVWFGMDAAVMPGISIGDGAIVAARAVVVKDVAPYTVVAGNPAHPVRQRFPDAVVEALLAIRWWDWPVAKVEANLDAILAQDLAALRRAAEDLPR